MIKFLILFFLSVSCTAEELPKPKYLAELMTLRITDGAGSRGSAFVVRHKGVSRMVTNEHLCQSPTGYYEISSPYISGRMIVKALKISAEIDICVLDWSRTGGSALEFAPPQLPPDLKTQLVTFGYPNDLGVPSHAEGLLVAFRIDPLRDMTQPNKLGPNGIRLRGYDGESILTSIAIVGGYSGGPIVNAKMEVVGMNRLFYVSGHVSLGVGYREIQKFLDANPPTAK